MAVATVFHLVTGFYEIELERLHTHPRNIRKELGNLDELAGSISLKGILEPLLVATDGAVVCGNRRLAAAHMAKKSRVPCVVSEIGEAEAVELMLHENLQRSDLTPVEEADAYQQLLDFGQTAEQISDNVNVNADRIRRRVALLQLPNSVRGLLESHKITIGAAEELMPLKSHPDVIDSALAQFEPWSERTTPLAEFGWRIENAVRDVKREEARAASLAKAEQDGLKVIAAPKWDRKATQPIELGNGYGQLGVKAKDHSKLDCHAVFVGADGKLQPACTKPKNHPDAAKKLESSGGQQRSNYEAERAAAAERHALVVGLLRGYVEAHPAGSAEVHTLAVMSLRNGSYLDSETTICTLLGIDVPDSKVRSAASKAFAAWMVQGATVIRGSMPIPETTRLQKARLAIDLAQLDAQYADGSVDETDCDAWIAFLTGLGYEPDEDELKSFDVERVLAWSERPAVAFERNSL